MVGQRVRGKGQCDLMERQWQEGSSEHLERSLAPCWGTGEDMATSADDGLLYSCCTHCYSWKLLLYSHAHSDTKEGGLAGRQASDIPTWDEKGGAASLYWKDQSVSIANLQSYHNNWETSFFPSSTRTIINIPTCSLGNYHFFPFCQTNQPVIHSQRVNICKIMRNVQIISKVSHLYSSLLLLHENLIFPNWPR